jgi:hypothetical protein
VFGVCGRHFLPQHEDRAVHAKGSYLCNCTHASTLSLTAKTPHTHNPAQPADSQLASAWLCIRGGSTHIGRLGRQHHKEGSVRKDWRSY